jgi:secreted Zn-dependent insulinase-like peptidase
MKVMVISTDDRTDRNFYMALSIALGTVHSPRRLQGLAHLLEHIIVAQLYGTGTVKGRTMDLHTHYSISGPVEKMVDRVLELRDAVFDPEFTEGLIEQSLEEVEQEFNCRSTLKESEMVQLTYKTVLDPLHPVCHFRAGNRKSLGGVSVEELRNFHRKYVSPHIVTMVVYSSMSLQEMKAPIVRMYGKVQASREVRSLQTVTRRLRDPEFAAQLRDEEEKEKREIPWLNQEILGKYVWACPTAWGEGITGAQAEVIFEFYFETDRKIRYYAKPLKFLVEVLNHKGEANLGFFLEERKLVTEVVASEKMSNVAVDILQVRMKLSKEAAKSEKTTPGSIVRTLAKYLFVYINMFKKGRFAVDPRPLANHAERWAILPTQADFDPLRFVVGVAEGLREFEDYKEAVIGGALIRRATPQLIKSYWDRMHRENLVIRLHGEIFAEKCNQLEPYHDVPFGIAEIPWCVSLEINQAEQMREGELEIFARARGFTPQTVASRYDLVVSSFYAVDASGVPHPDVAEAKPPSRNAPGCGGAGEACAVAGVMAAVGAMNTGEQQAEPRWRSSLGGGMDPQKVLLPVVAGTAGSVFLDDGGEESKTNMVRVEISFFSPWLQTSMRNYAIAQVVRRCYAGILHGELHSARMRGYSHGMQVMENKMMWSFEGPMEGIGMMVEEYVEIIKKNRLPHERCRKTLELSKERLGNRVEAMSAEDQAYHRLNWIIKSPYYSEWEMKKIVEELDYDRDFIGLTNTFWRKVANGGVLKAGVTGYVGDVETPIRWIGGVMEELKRREGEEKEEGENEEGEGVKVGDADFVDLRERQLRELTICQRSVSSRSRTGAVLVSVQVHGTSEMTTTEFTAILEVFQWIVHEIFIDYIGEKFEHANLPYAKAESSGGMTKRAQIHLMVTGRGEGKQIVEEVDNFVENLAEKIIEYGENKIDIIKRKRADVGLKILDNPERRQFFFFSEINKENPRFSWPQQARDAILAVSRKELVDLARQVSTAPRIRIVIKHEDDHSVPDSTQFLEQNESFSKWKFAPKGFAHRPTSSLGARKHGRSDSNPDDMEELAAALLQPRNK